MHDTENLLLMLIILKDHSYSYMSHQIEDNFTSLLGQVIVEQEHPISNNFGIFNPSPQLKVSIEFMVKKIVEYEAHFYTLYL